MQACITEERDDLAARNGDRPMTTLEIVAVAEGAASFVNPLPCAAAEPATGPP
jgi:hypothetical protein